LNRQGQFTDLVQENRSAVCFFQAPFFHLGGAGKGSFFVAEQLRFNQIVGQRGTVHFGKRISATLAQFVDNPGGERFAGPRFAQQKHRGSAGCNLSDHLVQALHGRTDAHRKKVIVFGRYFGPQAAVFRKQVGFPPLHLAVELNELGHQRRHNGQKTDVFLEIHFGAE
jgi:hypothetical protein